MGTNRFYVFLILASFFIASCNKHDTPPPKPPVAEAGNPQTIQLPVNSATLTGSGASTNGNITSYLWTLVSGPNVPVIGQAASASTSVSGMIQGVYHFQLKVTDVANLTGTDTTSITVLPYDVQTGLVAYYNFNGGSLSDGSGYGNNITFNNATPTSDRHGDANNAYLFNGTSSYMQVPNSASLNPNNITLMAIFKVNDYYHGLCHGNQLLGKGTPDYINGFYALRFSDFVVNCTDPLNTNNEKFFGAFSGAGGAADTPLVKTGQWYNLTFSYDGNNARLYLNGELKWSWQTSISFLANSHDVFIGRHEDNVQFPYWFNGVIDEIRIYNRALPDGAVKQLSQ